MDRANAEDAALGLPKVLDIHEKKNKHQNLSSALDEVMADSVDSRSQAKFIESKGIFCICLAVLPNFIHKIDKSLM